MPEVDPAANEAASRSVKLGDEARDALASKIDDQFAKAMTSDDDTPEPEPVAEPAAAAPVTDTVEKPADEPAAVETEEKPETVEEAAPAEAGPTLRSAVNRTLKAYGWTDAEIKSNLESMGAKFIESAERMHDTRSKEVDGWAEAGRAAKHHPAQVTTPAPAPAQTSQLKPVDVEALKKEFGDEPVIARLVGPINQQIEAINRLVPVVEQYQESQRRSQMEQIGRQVEGFFGSKDLEPYKEQYGADPSKLTTEQLASRQKVLETADAIYGGAKLQGRNLSLDECLNLAHDSVSGVTKETVARAGIVKQLQQRAAAVTLKPGAKKTPVSNAPAKNRTELESRVSRGLAAAFA